jgi:hypothetical protein
MSFNRDKIGDHEDWKDGHDAFRKNAIQEFKSLHSRINELELIIEERLLKLKS